MRDDDELLDIAQAAAFLKVSETSLRRWTNSGRLPHLRVGQRRERRFKRSDLVAFMEHGPALGRVDAAGDGPDRHAMVDGQPMRHGSHQCGLYASELGRMHLALRFLTGGLHNGSAAFVAGPRRMRDSLIRELRDVEPGFNVMVEERRLVFSDYARSVRAQLEYWSTSLRDAQRDGARSLRVLGDGTRFAERVGVGAVIEYETEFTRFIAANFPVVSLCLYDARKLSGRDVVRLLKSHSARHPRTPHPAHAPDEPWLA